MANVKISQLSSAATLTGSEEVAIVQSNATVKTTAQAIADLASGGGGLGTLDIVTVGELGISGSINFSIKSAYSGSVTGTQSSPITINADIYFYGSAPASTATSISFPTLVNANSITINNFSLLQTIAFPELLYTEGLNVTSNSALTTLSFPKLVTVAQNGLQIGSSTPYTLTSVSFPDLVSARVVSNLTYAGVTSFTSTIFPVIENFSIGVQNSQDLTEITLPSVTNIYSQGISVNTYNNSLTKVHLANVVSINAYNISFNGCSGLNDVQIGTVGVTKTYSANGQNPSIDFSGCNLSQASVDGILAVWASLDGTNDTTNVSYGNMYLSGGTNASPSGAGLASISVLQSRGWYIAYN